MKLVSTVLSRMTNWPFCNCLEGDVNMRYKLATFLILSSLIPLNAHAIEYQIGYRALEIFDAQGMEITPMWVKIWIAAATLCFAVGLFFVRRHSIARWVVGGYIAGLMVLIFSPVFFDLIQLKLAGFNALIHVIFWSPSLYLLLTKRPFFSKKVSAFSIWSGLITVVMIFSFFFDIPYSFIYLRHIFFDII